MYEIEVSLEQIGKKTSARRGDRDASRAEAAAATSHVYKLYVILQKCTGGLTLKKYRYLSDAATAVSYNRYVTIASRRKRVISMQADVENVIRKT